MIPSDSNPLGLTPIETIARCWHVPVSELRAVLASYDYHVPFSAMLADHHLLALVRHYRLQDEINSSLDRMRSQVAALPANPGRVYASLKSGGTAAVAQKGAKVPVFKGVAYHGVPVGAATSTPRLESDYVIDLAGMKPARNPKVNLQHDRSKRVGHVTKFYNNGKQIELAGLLSAATEYSAQVASSASSGYTWELSIEADMTRPERLAKGAVATVNGRQVAGPVIIFRAAELTGVAFVDAGADRETTVEVSDDFDE